MKKLLLFLVLLPAYLYGADNDIINCTVEFTHSSGTVRNTKIYFKITSEVNRTVELSRYYYHSDVTTSPAIPTDAKKIAIPQEVEYNSTTYTVLGIGKQAFMGCSSLTELTLPESLKYLDEAAFWSCSSLKSLTLPNGIEEIGKECFYGVSKLSQITLPDALTSIGEGAFSGCGVTNISIPDGVEVIPKESFSSSKLQSVHIGSGCKVIAGDAFNGSTSVSISISENNPYFSVQDNVLYNYGKTELISYLPSNTAEEFSVPNSVTKLGLHCFNNKKLKTITISSNVNDISGNPFSGCISLERIEVSNDNNSYASVDGVLFTKDLTKLLFYPYFKNDLTSYTIPSSVTEIGIEAFYDSPYTYVNNSRNLTTITFPESIRRIDDRAYYRLDIFTDIILPNIVSIGKEAFRSCTYLTNVSLGASIEEIKDSAFNSCIRLQTVQLGENLKHIGNDAFYNCKVLTSITIPNNVESIGSGAFSQCSELSSVILGEKLKKIERNTFTSCIKIVSITIPDNVEEIGMSAFHNCNQLANLHIGDNVKYIRENAFSSCALNEVIIPNSVQTIEKFAFYDIDNLKTIVLGENVSSIGDRAFLSYDSRNRYTIYSKNPTPPLADNSNFMGYSRDGDPCSNINKLYVPLGSEAQYLEAPAFGWSTPNTTGSFIVMKHNEATLTLPFNADFSEVKGMDSYFHLTASDNLKAYQFKHYDKGSDVIHSSLIKGVIPSSTGLLITGTEGAYYCLDKSTDSPTTDFSSNKLVGVLERTNMDDMVASSANRYYIFVNGKFCVCSGGNLAAYKSYLDLGENANAKDISISWIDDETNSIESVTECKDSDSWISVQGIKMNKRPGKSGIYIHNNKKVYIK